MSEFKIYSHTKTLKHIYRCFLDGEPYKVVRETHIGVVDSNIEASCSVIDSLGNPVYSKVGFKIKELIRKHDLKNGY